MFLGDFGGVVIIDVLSDESVPGVSLNLLELRFRLGVEYSICAREILSIIKIITLKILAKYLTKVLSDEVPLNQQQ